MSFSKTAHILFISFLLIALYLGICIHTALNAPILVTQYLFSESGHEPMALVLAGSAMFAEC